MRTIAFCDTETTGLHAERRPWDIALIVRQPGQRDVEWQWFIHPADLDWAGADPVALDVGRFWDRHPNGAYLRAGGLPEAAPHAAGVYRLREVLPIVARETADKALIHGSNPHFDMETLAPRMREAGYQPGWAYHPKDLPNMIEGWLAGRGLPQPAEPKSDALFAAAGLDLDRYERHTALDDARLCRDAFDVVMAGAR